jgi:hypothetical protein
LEPNAPSQGASPLPADAPPLPPVAELKTYEEICTNPAKVWHKHLNNRILSRLSSAFAGALRACNVEPEINAVHQQMLTGPEQRDVDDAAEGNDDHANTPEAEAEGAQVLVEKGRPASYRPALELPPLPPSKNPCR